MIKKGTLELINNTPLVVLDKIVDGRVIYAKAEFMQPGGSVKDRAAYQLIKDAYESGELKKGQTVVEMTSGNMGAGLAVVCKQMGNPFYAVMSEGNSLERRKALAALGAELILTKQVDGTIGMVTGKDIKHAGEVAKKFAEEIGGFYAGQFESPACVTAHYNTTGPEIWEDLPEVEAFVSIVGSGGTFIGTSKYLKEKNPSVKCIAVEPKKAAILKTGKVKSAHHIIQGTGYGFVPPHWEDGIADEIITVSDSEVRDMTLKLSREQGLYVGYSSGANVAAAIKYMEKNPELKYIVTILCDTGYKYSDL
ncbi:MAG: cysteine synthase family protein [Fermentimonas sp.]|nr:cysteine synthase family protein [Fermentimonas sp.]